MKTTLHFINNKDIITLNQVYEQRYKVNDSISSIRFILRIKQDLFPIICEVLCLKLLELQTAPLT